MFHLIVYYIQHILNIVHAIQDLVLHERCIYHKYVVHNQHKLDFVLLLIKINKFKIDSFKKDFCGLLIYHHSFKKFF